MKKMNLEERLKNTPLDTRIKVAVTFRLIDLVVEAGLRGEGFWCDEDPNDVKLQALISKYTTSITKGIMKELVEYKEDQPTAY